MKQSALRNLWWIGFVVRVFLGQVEEEDVYEGHADHSPALAKPACVNGTEGGSLNSKAKAERRSSSSSNPSRKGVSTASKIRKLSTCKQQWPPPLPPSATTLLVSVETEELSENILYN